MSDPLTDQGREQELDQKLVDVANALAKWINETPLQPSAIHPVYDGHVVLMELIRQQADLRSSLDAALLEQQRLTKNCTLACHVCGKPATCIGAYEGAEVEQPACDTCCGHGNEDGRCMPIDEWVDGAAQELAANEAEQQRLRDELADWKAEAHKRALALLDQVVLLASLEAIAGEMRQRASSYDLSTDFDSQIDDWEARIRALLSSITQQIAKTDNK